MALQIDSHFNEKAKKWDIVLYGEVDVLTAPDLRATLNTNFSKNEEDMLLHLDHLNYIDSTGLGVMIGAYTRMQEKGKKLTLLNPRENIEKLLCITSLDKIFL
ncbi:STAS domain-containing protein [Sinanaerobacter sp. ZZT-01]|jgi:anti-anti-sigma factor|uniref:STAS domain-containing protein n=1 Tax=Sinanaerobacter sp. ZZT-01 TaxID=3111540 RepID=UPI002D7847C8|nr:STAS domain-containing protein [Sinanaerobacter sp. ZZT-01]WRR94770.1 STAS domain-containing protein [Sinanaerobacter sp. ZZT-01]